MREKTLNLAFFPIFALSLWLGATGRVSWWAVVLVWLSHVSARVRV